jgi:choline dehydrogenase-like flavoprotein
VGDSRWGYRGFLPYFRKVERYYKEDADPVEHGFEGPIYTQTAGTTGRPYPLREKAKAAWASVGVQEVVDANSGSPQGLGQSVEAWKDGKRQLANVTYPLDGVKVLTETLVDKVLLEKRGDSEVAVGVQLADGMQLRARTEVVVCAGAYRTPQLLMLSGIGPSDELSKHGIKSVVDAPHVGRNLHDHLMVPQLWRLRHPEEGLAVGSPKFNNPNYAKGLPLDWVVTQGVPQEGLEAACAKDGIIIQSDSKTVAGSGRSKLELYIVYVGASANPPVPLDGSHIMTTVVGLLPTSRGSVTLSSRDPSANPVIDNNYYATEHDRYVMRTGLKQVAQMMVHNVEGQELVVGETVAEGLSPLRNDLGDEELDQRVRFAGG